MLLHIYIYIYQDTEMEDTPNYFTGQLPFDLGFGTPTENLIILLKCVGQTMILINQPWLGMVIVPPTAYEWWVIGDYQPIGAFLKRSFSFTQVWDIFGHISWDSTEDAEDLCSRFVHPWHKMLDMLVAFQLDTLKTSSGHVNFLWISGQNWGQVNLIRLNMMINPW